MEKTKTEGILRKRIDDIEKYQKQLYKLREIEKVVLKSELKDISTIYTVLDWISELCKNRDNIITS